MTQILVELLRTFSPSHQRTSVRTLIPSSAMAGTEPNPNLYQVMEHIRYCSHLQVRFSGTHSDIATRFTPTTTMFFTPLLANTRRINTPRAFKRKHSHRPTRARRLCTHQATASQTPESRLDQLIRFHWRQPTSRTQRCDTRIPCLALWILSTAFFSQLSSHFPITPKVMCIFFTCMRQQCSSTPHFQNMRTRLWDM